MTKTVFPLPQDWRDAVLVGRIDMGEGPTPVVVQQGRVFDVSQAAPTVSVLLEKWNGVPQGRDLGDINDLGLETAWANGGKPKVKLLAPVDLQCVKAVGATLGNDVNLRDYEGRSALLLGKAKDNNAALALGPFIRMFDDKFTIDDVRQAVVELEIVGADNYRLEGRSTMAEISRDPLELVKQTFSEHQYPDGFVLFLGSLFAPIQDRDVKGSGFTDTDGDVVCISSPNL